MRGVSACSSSPGDSYGGSSPPRGFRGSTAGSRALLPVSCLPAARCPLLQQQTDRLGNCGERRALRTHGLYLVRTGGARVGRRCVGSVLEAVPGPAGDAQAFGYVVGGVVVGRHGCRGGPGEVVVQHLPEGLVGEADVIEGLVETGDRALVHLLVRAVAAVDAHDRRLVAVVPGVAVGSAECLGPVGREPLAVLGVEAVAEGVR